MAKKIGPWTQLSSQIKYRNPWISIREHQVIKPNGKKGSYGVVESRYDSVFIVPVSKDNKIVLIKTYRFPTKNWAWEVPAGGIDGQQFLTAAKRELLEETGYKAKTWKKIGKAASFNGVSNEWMHIFLAKDLVPTNSNKQREEGIGDMKAVSFSTIKKMIKSKDIADSQTLTSIFLTANYLKLK